MAHALYCAQAFPLVLVQSCWATPSSRDASIWTGRSGPGNRSYVRCVGQGRRVFAISLTLRAMKENRRFSRRTLPYIPIQLIKPTAEQPLIAKDKNAQSIQYAA